MKLKTNDEKSVKSHQVYINQSMLNITTEFFFLQTFTLVFVVINIFAIAGCSLPSLCYILLIQHQSTPFYMFIMLSLTVYKRLRRYIIDFFLYCIPPWEHI